MSTRDCGYEENPSSAWAWAWARAVAAGWSAAGLPTQARPNASSRPPPWACTLALGRRAASHPPSRDVSPGRRVPSPPRPPTGAQLATYPCHPAPGRRIQQEGSSCRPVSPGGPGPLKAHPPGHQVGRRATPQSALPPGSGKGWRPRAAGCWAPLPFQAMPTQAPQTRAAEASCHLPWAPGPAQRPPTPCLLPACRCVQATLGSPGHGRWHPTGPRLENAAFHLEASEHRSTGLQGSSGGRVRPERRRPRGLQVLQASLRSISHPVPLMSCFRKDGPSPEPRFSRPADTSPLLPAAP